MNSLSMCGLVERTRDDVDLWLSGVCKEEFFFIIGLGIDEMLGLTSGIMPSKSSSSCCCYSLSSLPFITTNWLIMDQI